MRGAWVFILLLQYIFYIMSTFLLKEFSMYILGWCEEGEKKDHSSVHRISTQ